MKVKYLEKSWDNSLFHQDKSTFITGSAIVLWIFFTLFCAPVQAAEKEAVSAPIFITIGTGSVNGIYYPVGRAICNMVQHDHESPELLCSVERTMGSTYNLKALAAGAFEFGLGQSDQLAAAFHGTGEFKRPLEELRTVLTLYHESFTVLVRAESSIHQLRDLKHKKISAGLPGSGGYTTMHALMNYLHWNEHDIEVIDNLSNVLALAELNKKQLDAMIFTTGHPYKLLTRAATKQALRIVPVQGPEIESLLQDSFAYNRTIIPGGLYQGMNKPVETFGIMATLVSSRKVDKKIVYRVVKSIFENLDEFKQAQPLLSTLTRISMARNYLFVPLHSGSIKYFQEAGLLDKTSSSTANQ